MSLLTARRALMLGLATLALAGTAQAQSSTTSNTSPTPEGTVIRNEASATYTDGSTTYTAANAFVEVTVGFLAGVTLPAADASQTPATGSVGNEYTFSITNSGNGTDSVGVAFVPSANVTITGYRINGGAVLDALLLDVGLSTTALAMGASVNVTVIYSVGAVVGGASETIDITARSRRTPAVTDTHQLDITPASVAVTPDGGAVSNLPGTYTATYTVTNNSSLTLTYGLTASSSSAAATIGAITHGAGGTFTAGATPTLELAAGQSGTVNVSYTIPSTAAAGATATLQLTAATSGSPSVSDSGSWSLTVNRPVVVMTKEAWLDDESAQISGPVRPGDWIKYRIVVRNDGNAAASNITVTDVLPTEVTFTIGATTGDAAGWDFAGTTATTVQAVLDTLATGGAGTQRHFWIRVQVK